MKPGKQIKNGTKAFQKCCHDSTEVSIRKLGSLISDFPSFFVISFCVAITKCRLKHSVTNRTHWMMTKTKQIANENAKTNEREGDKEREKKIIQNHIRFNAHKVIPRKCLIFHSVGWKIYFSLFFIWFDEMKKSPLFVSDLHLIDSHYSKRKDRNPQSFFSVPSLRNVSHRISLSIRWRGKKGEKKKNKHDIQRLRF